MAAIYDWIEADLQVFTTTPYPLEYWGQTEFGFAVDGGSLAPIPVESYDSGLALLAFTLDDILIAYGPDNQPYDTGLGLIAFTKDQILITYGPDNQPYDTGLDLVTFTLTLKLVIGDTPDQEQQMAFVTKPSSCSMTPA
jgi:hypothetical protein